MDLRHLRYFIAVAETLSFTRAAERLRIAQPPLSQQIRKLEDSLGVTLLYRTKRRVELSEAGRIFLEEARLIIAATQAAAAKAQRAQRGEVGRLAVGFFEHMSYTYLPPIVRAFRERFPAVDVQLRWFPVIGQAEALRRGDVDISFMRPVPDVDVFATKTLVKEPFVIALPDTHPLAARATVSLKACARERFVMYTPSLAPDFHGMIIRMCAAAGFVPQLALEVGQVYTVLGLVSSGAGFAFVPSSVQRVHVDHVAYRPLRDPGPKVEVMLGWNQRNPSPQLASFVQTAHEVVTRIRSRSGTR